MITASKFFLYKDVPEEQVTRQDLVNMYLKINEYVNSLSTETNKVNESLLKSLDSAAASIKQTNKQLGPIVSRLSDILIAGSESKDSVNLFTKNLKVSGRGLKVDTNTEQIYIKRKPLVDHKIKDIAIATERGSVGNTVGNNLSHFNLDNLTSSTSHTEFESYGDELRMAMIIDLGEKKVVNNIEMKFISFGTRAPSIGEISTSEDGCAFKKMLIKSSNDYSIDLDDFNFKDGKVYLSIKETYTRYVRIVLNQKMPYLIGTDRDRRYAIGVNSLKIGFNTAEDQGDIIIGPMKSEREILKAAISAEVRNQEEGEVSFAISHDGKSWIPIRNSEIFRGDSRLSKIVNYNNVAKNTHRTNDPVFTIYLKISMQSFDVSKLNPRSRYVNKESISISRQQPMAQIADIQDPDFLEVYKETGTFYGRKQSISSQQVALEIDYKSISEVFKDEARLVNSVAIKGPGVRDVLDPITVEDKMNVVFKEDCVFITKDDKIANKPSMDFDPFLIDLSGRCSIIRAETPIRTTVNDEVILDDSIFVIPLSVKRGIYHLRFDNYKVQINLLSGVLYSVYESVYIIDKTIKKVTLENEIGEFEKTLEIKTHGDLRYISLIDEIGEDLPDFGGFFFSKTMPLEILRENQYTIVNGKLLFGKYFGGNFPAVRVKKTTIETKLESAPSGSILVSDDSKQIITEYTLHDEDLKKVIKLNHVNILPGTISFDVRSASINALVKEVRHIDGVKEFIVKKKHDSVGHRAMSKIPLHHDFIDDGEIEFKLCSGVFRDRVEDRHELIDKGHYLIEEVNGEKFIFLPEGVSTSVSSDTSLSYSIKPLKRSSSGLYSVDHKRGILYSTNPIDGKTKIKYQYSTVHASYMGLSLMQDWMYGISKGAISIEHEGDVPVKYIIIRSGAEANSIEYKETPVMNNIKLNLMHTESIL